MEQSDQDRFREFVTARQEPLRALAYATCGDWHAADDAVANALAKLYPRWSKVEHPDIYVRTMVVRAAIDEKRRPWRRERSAGEALPDITQHDSTDSTNEWLIMRAAMLKLTPKQRAALVLRYYEGLSTAETAQILNCNEGTVKSQCSRALKKLREILGDKHITLDGADTETDSHTGAWEHAHVRSDRNPGIAGAPITARR